MMSKWTTPLITDCVYTAVH